jgi:predicted HicB family RNase H-like nuclease
VDFLEYKGYKGSVEFSKEDKLLIGKVLFIDSLIMYEAEGAGEIELAFHKAVDAYIDHCKAHGKEPNKSFSGNFNIRTKPALHKACSETAISKGITLNQLCNEALEAYVNASLANRPLIINPTSPNNLIPFPTNVSGSHSGIAHSQVSSMASSENQIFTYVQPIVAGITH